MLKRKKKRPQKPIHCLSWKVKESPQGPGLNEEKKKE